MEDKSRAYYQRLLNQYLEGTISEEGRFALEKQALDDHFLFEALQGLQSDSNENKEAISKLKSKIDSKAKSSEKTKRISLFNYGIAASLVLLLGVGMWFLNSNLDQNDTVVMNTVAQEAIPETQEAASTNNEPTKDLELDIEETKSIASTPKIKIEKSNNQYDSPKAKISQAESEQVLQTSDIAPDDTRLATVVADNRNQLPAIEDREVVPFSPSQEKETKNTPALVKNKIEREASAKADLSEDDSYQATAEVTNKREVASEGAIPEVISAVNKPTTTKEELTLAKTEYIRAIDKNVLAAPEEGITEFKNILTSTSQKLRSKKTKANNILIQFRINENGEPSTFEIISGEDHDCINMIISRLQYGSKWITLPAKSAAKIQLELPCN